MTVSASLLSIIRCSFEHLRSRRAHGALFVALGPAAWLVAVAARHVWTEYHCVRPARARVADVDPALLSFSVEPVSLRTADGIRLEAWYIPSRNGAAVALFHGTGGNRHQLAPDAAMLAQRGYGVILVDMRAHGASAGEMTTYGERERYDVLASIDFLASRPEVQSTRIGVVGFSAGATAAVLAARQDPRVRALVLEAAMSSMEEFCRDEAGAMAWLKAPLSLAVLRWHGIDPSGASPRASLSALAPTPILFVHGARDTNVPLERARANYAVARQPKTLRVFADVGHHNFAEAPGYRELLTAFFDRWLSVRI